MKILLYTKAPCLWTLEEWKMTDEERDYPEVTFENSPQEVELVIKK